LEESPPHAEKLMRERARIKRETNLNSTARLMSPLAMKIKRHSTPGTKTAGQTPKFK
jgi:hypothetical protein